MSRKHAARIHGYSGRALDFRRWLRSGGRRRSLFRRSFFCFSGLRSDELVRLLVWDAYEARTATYHEAQADLGGLDLLVIEQLVQADDLLGLQRPVRHTLSLPT